MAIPRILKNFGASVNGRGFQGRVDECELPDVSLKLEEYRGGGMDAPTDIDMGQEKMGAKLTITDPDAPLLKLVGTANNNSARVILRGAFVRDSDNSVTAVVAEIGGRFNKVSMGKWKAGDKNAQEFEVGVNFYSLTIDGEEIFYIDVENMIRRIGGEDQLAAIRDAIGL